MTLKKGWTLEKEIWNKVPDIVMQKKWGNIKVTINASSQLPESPGIYMYCVKQEYNGLKLQNPMYIGKSMNIKRRFMEHYRNNERIKELKNCFRNKLDFCFLKLPSDTPDDVLRILEQNVLDAYGPEFNERDSVAVSSPLRVTLGRPIEF